MTYDYRIEENRTLIVLKQIILVGCYLLFGISLFNVGFCTDSKCILSFEALLTGWLVMFADKAGISWLATPLLIISWVLINKTKRISILLSLISVLLSLFFLTCNTIIVNEAGTASQITVVKNGYWLWLSSCFLTFIGSLAIFFFKRHLVRRLNTN